MRLADHVELFSLGGIPMVGNLETGGVIGLTGAGETLCRKMSERDVAADEAPAECAPLVEHLRRGGYLASPECSTTQRERVRSAYLHVTQRCNLRCKFCYSEGDDRNLLPDPSVEHLARAIGMLASLGAERLVISGGEPFLRDDLPDIARVAATAGIEEIVVLTNGLLVSEKNVTPLVGIVSCIGVAFDGCSQGADAHLRGEQNFDRLVAATKAIRAAGIAARVLPTIHGRNLEDMDRYRDVARKLGASVGFSMLTAPLSELGEFAIGDDRLADLGRTAADDGLDYGDDLPGEGSLGVRMSCACPAARACVRSASPRTERSTPATCCTTVASPWAMPFPTMPRRSWAVRSRASLPSSTPGSSNAVTPAAGARCAAEGAARGRSCPRAASPDATRTARSQARTTTVLASACGSDSPEGGDSHAV